MQLLDYYKDTNKEKEYFYNILLKYIFKTFKVNTEAKVSFH